jgi:hypothetical protein
MTVKVITLVGIEVMDLLEDPIRVMDLIEVMAVIMAINDKL